MFLAVLSCGLRSSDCVEEFLNLASEEEFRNLTTATPPPFGEDEERPPKEILVGDPDIQEVLLGGFLRRREPMATLEAKPVDGAIGAPPEIRAELRVTREGFCLGAVLDRAGNQVEGLGEGGAVLRPEGGGPENLPGGHDGFYDAELNGVPPETDDGGARQVCFRPLRWTGEVKEEGVRGGRQAYIPRCSDDPRVFVLQVQNDEPPGPDEVGGFITSQGWHGFTVGDRVIVDLDPPDRKLERAWEALANELGIPPGDLASDGWRQWSDQAPVAFATTDRHSITWTRYHYQDFSSLPGVANVLDAVDAEVAGRDGKVEASQLTVVGTRVFDVERLSESITGLSNDPIFAPAHTPASPEVREVAEEVLSELVNQGVLSPVNGDQRPAEDDEPAAERREEDEDAADGEPEDEGEQGPSDEGGDEGDEDADDAKDGDDGDEDADDDADDEEDDEDETDDAELTAEDYKAWEQLNPQPVQQATHITAAQDMILDVPTMAPCGRQCANPEGAELKPVPGGGLDPSLSDSPLVLIESLGASTGQAFRVFAIGGGMPSLPSGHGLVLEAVALPERAQRRLRESVEGATATVWNGYCLQFLRQVPVAGMIYRIAGPAGQGAAHPLRPVLAAGRALRDQGALNPDSEAESYFHSILQWAIWTREQGFDEASFTTAFLEHTEQSFRRSGVEWTAEVERAVRGYASGRWRDIQAVLREAAS